MYSSWTTDVPMALTPGSALKKVIFNFKALLIVSLMLANNVAFGLEVKPAAHDFGDVIVGQSSAAQLFRVLNRTSSRLHSNSIKATTTVMEDALGNLTTTYPDEFVIHNDTCSSADLGVTPSLSVACEFAVLFKPKSVGRKKLVFFENVYNKSGQLKAKLVVSVTGNGVLERVPDIKVEPGTTDFGSLQVGRSSNDHILKISNIGTKPLQLKPISWSETQDFIVTQDLCSNKTIGPAKECSVITRFQPKSLGAKTVTFSIPSDDSDTPISNVTLNGTGIGWCSGEFEREFLTTPASPDFGTEIVNNTTFLNIRINNWTKGCGSLQMDDITLTGTDATEFSIKKQRCYHGSDEENTFYSNCRVTTVFSPTSEGTKNAELKITFNDTTVKTIPLLAKAVNSGEANLEISPTSHDFGTVSQGRQRFLLTNTGNINLKLDSLKISGVNSTDFQARGCRGVVNPSQTCRVRVFFKPQLRGNKQASLNLSSNAPATVAVPLTATVKPADCSEENITIESVASGWWAEKRAAENRYDRPSPAWKRLRDFNSTNELQTPNRPREDDVVRIKAGHKITGIPYARIKALCIDNGATLESLNLPQGTPLEIQASDYIENRGNIFGQAGDHEISNEISCTDRERVGMDNCAYPGGSVILKVGTDIRNYGKSGDWWWYSYASGGPFLNEGQILAGHGGNGSQYGAPGGDTIVLGRNTTNKGAIKAGHGGDILGLATGTGGEGGLTQLWGKLGGPGYLYNTENGQVFAGDGGNCNQHATAAQMGGKGGNLWFVSLPDVHINGGQHHAGKGGNKCTVNGEDGWVRIEPNVIDLSGAQTLIDQGQVAIYGGNDWTLDLSRLNSTVVTATGNITLATGETGAIDLRGSTGKILKAEGQVYIFANDILLDADVTLFDLIEATNIVVGPSKLLQDVVLTAPAHLFGEPETVLPIRFILSNGGSETDTYLLNVTNTAGWPVSQLPPSIEIEGLESVELVLNVTLPSTRGIRDIITVAAISQTNPKVVTTSEVRVTVATRGTYIKPTINTGQKSNCPSSGFVNQVCKYPSDQILAGITFGPKASVSGGRLRGIINNSGLVSPFWIESGAVLTGGKLTGGFINEGTLVDIEFVGGEVTGGTLQGNIFNHSEVRGTFTDISLAANTVITGGYLAGQIEGDCDAPARLENLTIIQGSHLSCVIVGENVILPTNLTCGEGVQGAQEPCPDQDISPTLTFPTLGASATNAQGQTINTSASLFGGISVNEAPFEPTVTIQLSDTVDIQGHITVDPKHVDQPIEIFVYAAYQPLKDTDNEPQPLYFMLNEEQQVQFWDEKPASLLFLNKIVVEELGETVAVPMYDGSFEATGILNISFGYRLPKGTLVRNSQTLDVTIIDD